MTQVSAHISGSLAHCVLSHDVFCCKQQWPVSKCARFQEQGQITGPSGSICQESIQDEASLHAETLFLPLTESLGLESTSGDHLVQSIAKAGSFQDMESKCTPSRESTKEARAIRGPVIASFSTHLYGGKCSRGEYKFHQYSSEDSSREEEAFLPLRAGNVSTRGNLPTTSVGLGLWTDNLC